MANLREQIIAKRAALEECFQRRAELQKEIVRLREEIAELENEDQS